jgi:hypothetical protein
MKAEIYKLYPELQVANNLDETLQRLIIVAREAQNAMEDRILYNLSVTMPHRVVAVIDTDG